MSSSDGGGFSFSPEVFERLISDNPAFKSEYLKKEKQLRDERDAWDAKVAKLQAEARSFGKILVIGEDKTEAHVIEELRANPKIANNTLSLLLGRTNKTPGWNGAEMRNYLGNKVGPNYCANWTGRAPMTISQAVHKAIRKGWICIKDSNGKIRDMGDNSSYHKCVRNHDTIWLTAKGKKQLLKEFHVTDRL